jgi:hypothetical protein
MQMFLSSAASHREWIVLIGSLNKNLAYLDPGSGSFILQIVLATLLASLLFMKNFWRKIVSIFKRSSPGDQEASIGSGEEDEEGK